MNRNNIRENKAGKEMELNQNQEKLKEYRKRAKELVAQMTLEEKGRADALSGTCNPKTWDKGVQLVERGTARCGKSGNGNRISTGNRNGCDI